jgi:hypothetical protein
MKVKELIEKLLTYDQEAEIVIQDYKEMMTLYEIESFGYVPTSIGKTLAINAEYCDDRSNDPPERWVT